VVASCEVAAMSLIFGASSLLRASHVAEIQSGARPQMQELPLSRSNAKA
jgi:hypothetical protein